MDIVEQVWLTKGDRFMLLTLRREGAMFGVELVDGTGEGRVRTGVIRLVEAPTGESQARTRFLAERVALEADNHIVGPPPGRND